MRSHSTRSADCACASTGVNSASSAAHAIWRKVFIATRLRCPTGKFKAAPSGPAHQFQHRRQSQAALAGERGSLDRGALLVAGAGETDSDLMAAKHGILALGRCVLLVENLT